MGTAKLKLYVISLNPQRIPYNYEYNGIGKGGHPVKNNEKYLIGLQLVFADFIPKLCITVFHNLGLSERGKSLVFSSPV